MTLQEMEDRIKSEYLLTEIYGSDFLLITKRISNNKVRYYMIAKQTKNSYLLMNPASNISESFILTPFHLLGLSSEMLSPGEIYEISAGTEYKINSSYDEIADFYKAIEIYKLVEEDSRILISVKDDAYISEGYAKHTRGTFAIEFEE
ncbi:MAG: hypothetical protein ACOCRK_09240, partial [bacterium]